MPGHYNNLVIGFMLVCAFMAAPPLLALVGLFCFW